MLNKKNSLGFRKTTNKVSIGRRLTKPFLQRKILIHFLLSVILGLVVSYGLCGVIKAYNIIMLIGLIIIFMTIQILAYGFRFGEINSLSIQNNLSLFMEIDEKGIYFIPNKTFKERISYTLDVLRGKDGLKHMHFEEISSVKIKKVIRLMKIPGSNLPTDVKTYDYYFKFKDGTNYNLINPLILENDVQLIKNILKNNIDNLILE